MRGQQDTPTSSISVTKVVGYQLQPSRLLYFRLYTDMGFPPLKIAVKELQAKSESGKFYSLLNASWSANRGSIWTHTSAFHKDPGWKLHVDYLPAMNSLDATTCGTKCCWDDASITETSSKCVKDSTVNCHLMTHYHWVTHGSFNFWNCYDNLMKLFI